jgi:hypothetical protein
MTIAMTTPSALTPASRIVASTDHAAAQVGGETVILSMAAGRYFGMGSIGTRIWQLLQQPITIDVLRRDIVSGYRVDAARCEADLIAFVGQLMAAGLVRQVDDSAS